MEDLTTLNRGTFEKKTETGKTVIGDVMKREADGFWSLEVVVIEDPENLRCELLARIPLDQDCSLGWIEELFADAVSRI